MKFKSSSVFLLLQVFRVPLRISVDMFKGLVVTRRLVQIVYKDAPVEVVKVNSIDIFTI